MTCTPPTEQPATLEEAAARAICWADHALSSHGRPMLDAIWWLSTHLVAADRVLHEPLLKQREHRTTVREQRGRAREIHAILWALDRHLTGDVRLAGRSSQALVDDLRSVVHTYAERELLLVQAAGREADAAAQQRLAVDYARAVRRAPTRPHPLAHRPLLLHSPFLRLEGILDHLRDAIDSRHVPMTSRSGG